MQTAASRVWILFVGSISYDNNHRALTGATIPDQGGPGRDSNEGLLCIPQSSSITGTSPSYCLVSYVGHSLLVFYPSAESILCILQPQPTGLVGLMSYAGHTLGSLTPLQRSSRCILHPQLTGLAGLAFYAEQSMGESYPSVEKQSVYSTSPIDWTGWFSVLCKTVDGGVLPFCREAVDWAKENRRQKSFKCGWTRSYLPRKNEAKYVLMWIVIL